MSIWNRQQYLDLMQFKPVPRPFFAELFGPLVGLEEEWQAQGAGPTELDLSTFGFDGVQRRRVPIYTGIFPWRQKRVISESDTELIQEDHYGRRMKLCKGFATIPLPQSHPVADMDDWMGLRDRYCFHAGRLEPDWDQPVAADTMSVLYIPGGFDEPRQLLGEEELCCAVYEQPELIHDMLTVIGDQIVLVLQRLIQAGVRVDQISIHEDMAGKSGPLFGPTQIETFLQSYYQRVWTQAQEAGAQLFSQDSDGDMRPVIDAFKRCGVNVMFPCEPAAGMDITTIRAEHGSSLALAGGIDKHVLRQGQQAIDVELERKLIPALHSGCVFGLDHRIPGGTPLDAYRYYVRNARERLGLEPNPEPGWQRMAF